MPFDLNKEEMIHVRFSDKALALIDFECHRLGMKRTEFVRYAVARFFENLQTTEPMHSMNVDQLRLPEETNARR
jgi:hypothetical protein